MCARLPQLTRSPTANQVLGFNPRPGRGFNFGQLSFATLSIDRDIELLAESLNILLGNLKEPAHLSIRVGQCLCCEL